MANDFDDTFLLTQLQRGNDQAAAILYLRYAESLHQRAIWRYRLRPEDADDAVQNTFSAIIEKIGTYNPERGPGRSWIYTIYFHAVVDILRKISLQTGRVAWYDIDPSSDPYALEQRVIQREWYDAMKRAWGQLSEEERQEIQQGRGRGPGRKAWHQAVQRFLELLTDQEHPDDEQFDL